MAAAPALCLILVLTGCGLRSNSIDAVPASDAGPSAALERNAAEQGIFDHVNRERAADGLHPLIWDPQAAAVAREHSRNMATRWFFSHLDPQGRYSGERLRAAGIAWRWSGENIYQHNDGEETASSSVRGWMRSPGHRQNILNRNFTHTGVGVQTGLDGTVYCTQVFYQPPAPVR